MTYKTSFEDVMKISEELLLENEFFDILSPDDIEGHKEIVNSMF